MKKKKKNESKTNNVPVDGKLQNEVSNTELIIMCVHFFTKPATTNYFLMKCKGIIKLNFNNK